MSHLCPLVAVTPPDSQEEETTEIGSGTRNLENAGKIFPRAAIRGQEGSLPGHWGWRNEFVSPWLSAGVGTRTIVRGIDQ
jgi:hypothetical protein